MKTLVLRLKGKGSDLAHEVSIHEFNTPQEAVIYIKEHHFPDRKYWVTAEIISLNTVYETYNAYRS